MNTSKDTVSEITSKAEKLRKVDILRLNAAQLEAHRRKLCRIIDRLTGNPLTIRHAEATIIQTKKLKLACRDRLEALKAAVAKPASRNRRKALKAAVARPAIRLVVDNTTQAERLPPKPMVLRVCGINAQGALLVHY